MPETEEEKAARIAKEAEEKAKADKAAEEKAKKSAAVTKDREQIASDPRLGRVFAILQDEIKGLGDRISPFEKAELLKKAGATKDEIDSLDAQEGFESIFDKAWKMVSGSE